MSKYPFQAIIRLNKKKKKKWHGPLSHSGREGKTLVVRPLRKPERDFFFSTKNLMYVCVYFQIFNLFDSNTFQSGNCLHNAMPKTKQIKLVNTVRPWYQSSLVFGYCEVKAYLTYSTWSTVFLPSWIVCSEGQTRRLMYPGSTMGQSLSSDPSEHWTAPSHRSRSDTHSPTLTHYEGEYI